MKRYFNKLQHLRLNNIQFVAVSDESIKCVQFYTTLKIMLDLEITQPTKLLLYFISENLYGFSTLNHSDANVVSLQQTNGCTSYEVLTSLQTTRQKKICL